MSGGADARPDAAGLGAAVPPGWRHAPSEGFIGLVGGVWLRDMPEGRSYGFLSRPCHANMNGVVHGGMLMSFIDRAMGESSITLGGAARGATITLTVNFLAPMPLDAFATMTPRIARMTGRMAFVEGAVLCDGATLATAQGIWRLSRSG